MRTIAVLLLSVLYQPCPGQTPRAVITGPKEQRPGSLVVLDATESQGLGRVWLLAISPEPTSFLPVEAGLKVIFASPTPGDYTFVLVVSGTNANGGPMADMATHTVTLLGPRPPPVVVTPPVVIPIDPPDVPPVVTPTKVDRVTYIYEKDKTNVPRPVAQALQQLNADGIVATEFEQDTTTGTGGVPAQYSKSLAAAKQAGLPCLVVEGGGEIIRVVSNPTTMEAVIEAAQ
jgi:hypothetical protein